MSTTSKSGTAVRPPKVATMVSIILGFMEAIDKSREKEAARKNLNNQKQKQAG